MKKQNQSIKEKELMNNEMEKIKKDNICSHKTDSNFSSLV